MSTIAERMSRDLLTVEPSATLGDAARSMVRRNVGSVCVIDDARLVGILTERDILRAFAEEAAPTTPVRERMTRTPETCASAESLEHATVLMLHGGFRHLPIVDEQGLVGMLSLRDVLGASVSDYAPRGV